MLRLDCMVKLALHERATLLRDIILSASDGVVTTFAVVAGSAGAGLTTNTVLILGFANLFADAISMSAGNYLGIKSENELQEKEPPDKRDYHPPVLHGLTSFFAFVIAGILPLTPFIQRGSFRVSFTISIVLVFLSLFFLGSIKAQYSKKNAFKGGMEVLFIGGIAAVVAYVVGFAIDRYIIG